MKAGLIIGTRGSKLALIQTGLVAQKLQHLYPQLKISVSTVLTTGDRDRHSRLDQMGEAVFVKELEQALLTGSIDIAVHSLKDLPTEIPSGVRLLAVTERDDPRDAVVARMKLLDLSSGSSVGTDSPRRSIQLAKYFPHLKICGLRGNLDTRLKKVDFGEVDAVVVAAAGMNRLGFQNKITEYLPLEQFLPSAGQGALAIEGRKNDPEVTDLIEPLNNQSVWQCVTAERAYLLALGGGCRVPIGAIGSVNGDDLILQGMVASLKSGQIIRSSIQGEAKYPEKIGLALAMKMISLGAQDFIAEVSSK